MGFAEIRAEATPRRRDVPVCFDGRLLSDLATAERALKDAARNKEEQADGQMLGDTGMQQLRERVQKLRERVREKTRTLVFEGIGTGRWRDLISEHPPTAEQADVYGKAVRMGLIPLDEAHYDPATFIPAAIARCCAKPGMSEEDAQWLVTEAPFGLIDRVWTAVLEVNLGGQTDPFVDASDGVPAGAKT